MGRGEKVAFRERSREQGKVGEMQLLEDQVVLRPAPHGHHRTDNKEGISLLVVCCITECFVEGLSLHWPSTSANNCMRNRFGCLPGGGSRTSNATVMGTCRGMENGGLILGISSALLNSPSDILPQSVTVGFRYVHAECEHYNADVRCKIPT